MRDIDTIDQELRLLSIVRATLREYGATGSTELVDRLLDERLDYAPSRSGSHSTEHS